MLFQLMQHYTGVWFKPDVESRFLPENSTKHNSQVRSNEIDGVRCVGVFVVEVLLHTVDRGSNF